MAVRLVVVLASLAVSLVSGFACDHTLSVNCFASLDNALGNVIGQGQGGAQVCGMIRNAYYNFFMCFKFSGCYQTILGECDQIVWSVNYNLVQTVNNDYYNGLDPNGPSATTNPYNCTLPTSCNELFGYPTVDGSFQIDTTNTSPATTATLSRLIALVGLAVASTAALM